jgi:hypothetical protein
MAFTENPKVASTHDMSVASSIPIIPLDRRYTDKKLMIESIVLFQWITFFIKKEH